VFGQATAVFGHVTAVFGQVTAPQLSVFGQVTAVFGPVTAVFGQHLPGPTKLGSMLAATMHITMPTRK
jgi:hypothetical protein